MRAYTLLLLLFTASWSAHAQNSLLKSMVVDARGGQGIAYVNIGIPGKNVGTVSNEQGQFELRLNDNQLADTLLFSCIGYEAVRVPVSLLRDMEMPVMLTPKVAELKPVQVEASRLKEKYFGIFTESAVVQAGFNDNVLGKECGVPMFTKQPALLDQVQINFGKCTYDSVFFRLNVYQKSDSGRYENILREPLVYAFSKVEIQETLAIDLRAYNIEVQGDFMISVEYMRDLGPGTLYFKSKLNKSSYVRATSQAEWVKMPVAVSIGVFALVGR